MKKILIGAMFLVGGIAAAFAGGLWMGFPIVGVPANTNCESYGNNGVCNQYTPAGPAAIPNSALIPADTGLSNGQNPQTIRVPITIFAQGLGTAQVVTTNASVVMTDGVSTLISNQGTVTIASIKLPPNPKDNQLVRIANAGSGVLTITAIAVGTTGQSIVGTAPASLAILTNNAAAAAENNATYVYKAANTSWYRIQ